MFARGLASAMLAGRASRSLDRRLSTSVLARLGGLAAEAPALASVVALGLATSLGVPCLVGFWGQMLALLGGFAPAPGAGDGAWRSRSWPRRRRTCGSGACCCSGSSTRPGVAARRSQPFGGRLPDASSRELAALVPVALLALLLGVWPTPLLAATAAGARDVSATVEPP